MQKPRGDSSGGIAPSRLADLNAGRAETTHLAECLAVDFATLMRTALPDMGEDAVATLESEAATGILRRMSLAARLIGDRLGSTAPERLRHHPSDTVRGWACFMIGAAEGLGLEERLVMIKPLADDFHFGVREWAWMAVRPHLAADLDAAIDSLAPWTASPSERIRRFACEAIRPRGVWCAHIDGLKKQPEKALAILDALRADPAAYVQDSVSNWLNDAAKTRPDWVLEICTRWKAESPGPNTARICKRALRSIDH